MTCIAGIDFGTSNSAISVSIDGEQPKLITFCFDDKEYSTTPTVVSYCDNRSILYGREAVYAYRQGEVSDGRGRFIKSIKRIVSSGVNLEDSTRIGLVNVRYIDIVKNFLSFLKKHAEQKILRNIDSVVIGRPVSFVDNNIEQDLKVEEAIRKVATEIGFKNIAFQYEPIAAAFACEQNICKETLALIIDIGGGTSDFSVIKLRPKSQKNIDRKEDILSNIGINIAGDDFDYDFSLNSFMPHFGYKSYMTDGLLLPQDIYRNLSNWTKNVNELKKEFNKYYNSFRSAQNKDYVDRLSMVINDERKFDVLTKVENTKIYLSDRPEKDINLNHENDCVAKIFVSRDDFERSIQNDLNKIKEKIEECINKSGKTKDDIETIIFTGGSTQIPLIQFNIINMFPKIKPENIIKSDVFSSVCMGLSYYGMNLGENK